MFEFEKKEKPAADYLMSLLDISENKRLIQDKKKRSSTIEVWVNCLKIKKRFSVLESHFDYLKI